MENTKEQHLSEVKSFERSYTRMLENMALASVMLNAQGKIVFVNSHLLDITGWKREEVMRRDWVDVFIPPERREKTRNTFLLVSSGIVEVSPYTENEILTKDGKVVP